MTCVLGGKCMWLRMTKACLCVIGVWNVWGRAMSRAGDGSQVSMPKAACLTQFLHWGLLHIAHASVHQLTRSSVNSAWLWWDSANPVCSVWALFICFPHVSFRYLNRRVFVLELLQGGVAQADMFAEPGDIIDEINGISLRNSSNGQVQIYPLYSSYV